MHLMAEEVTATTAHADLDSPPHDCFDRRSLSRYCEQSSCLPTSHPYTLGVENAVVTSDRTIKLYGLARPVLLDEVGDGKVCLILAAWPLPRLGLLVAFLLGQIALVHANHLVFDSMAGNEWPRWEKRSQEVKCL